MPSASCCFLLVFYFAGNQYQTESKCSETFYRFFGQEDIQWAKEVTEGRPVVSTRHQGAPGRPGVPWWVVPTTVASCTASLLYKYPNISETLWESTKINSSHRKFQKHQIQSRHHLGGVHHVHWCLSDDA